MGYLGVVDDAPKLIQAIILMAEPLLLRLFKECVQAGKTDIVLDMKVTDPTTTRVRVSVIERNRFRDLFFRFDPTNPFIGELKKNFEGRGFWVSVRDDEEHYIYPLLLSEFQN